MRCWSARLADRLHCWFIGVKKQVDQTNRKEIVFMMYVLGGIDRNGWLFGVRIGSPGKIHNM